MTAVLAVVAAALLIALAAVQLASDAIFAVAGAAYSLPARVPLESGAAIYRAISRVAPAPYVDDMLTRAALARGDLMLAQSYARRLPASSNRSELLGRIAQARGDERTAQQLFVKAGDILSIESQVHQLARALQPASAYALETRLNRRLQEGGLHPDAVAASYWQLGVLAIEWNRAQLAMTNFRRAAALSPISSKYLISAGFQAYVLHLNSEARNDFRSAINVDPRSADAYAGAGMVALRFGDRAAAQRDASRARALNPNSHALGTLQTLLEHQ